ncbi:MAG: gluconate 2-dehydrogenase subunit 3 family protein [Proteobacteria bacterium]|nr:gluconate 2-dehydrogenase subunit 3 family protein [Pseudomonadota bacterium]
MSHSRFNRRQFLSSSASLAKGSLLVLSVPAIVTACREASESRQQQAAFANLGAEEAAEFTAIAARIIPSDDTPGATEAGVIYFMDNVLGDPEREPILEALRDGLRELQYQIATEYNLGFFIELDVQQQDELLRANERTAFFNTMRYLTIAGTFSLPEYGGNRDNIGYNIIGFENPGGWAPPFGFYDADYRERGE